MDFVQRRTRVKYLFTQNRFLNTIDPSKHAWRWDENECSVHYDSSWTILKWDLESPWYQCPYIAPLSARSVDIAATREIPQDSRTLPERSARLIEEVKQEDWFRLADTPPDMTVRQNRFVTDVTMTGALFKLWESIRLHPTAEAISVLLRYLETLIHSDKLVFEETRYYQELLLKMTEADHQPDSNLSALRERYSEPTSAIEILGETRDFNIVSAVCRVFTATEHSDVKRYYAIAKASGPVELLRERFGNREPSGYKFVSDTLESVIQKAKAAEEGPPVVRLEGSLDGYNIIGTHSGFLAVSHALGSIDLFQERIGERELAPFILKAGTYEEIRKRITDRS